MTINNPFNLDPVNPLSNSSFNSVNVQEGMAPSGVNNALRQLAAFLAQATSYQSAAISASVSTNIAATGTGYYIPIVGPNAINSFGLVAGEQPGAAVMRILEFSSSASLSHGASLILLGGASRRTQPGDIGGYIHEGTSDQWREFLYNRADGSPLSDQMTVGSLSASMARFSHMAAQSASVSSGQYTSISASVGSFGALKFAGATVDDLYIQVKSVSSAASASTSSAIPYDTSAPTNSEGANLFSLSITPKSSASILEVEGEIHLSHGTTGVDIQVGLFLDNAATAFASGSTGSLAGNVTTIKIYNEHTASTISEHIYALRYGAASGSTLVNHTSGGNLGGTLRSWLRVKERL